MGTNLKETTKKITLNSYIDDIPFNRMERNRFRNEFRRCRFETIQDIMEAGIDGLQKFTNLNAQSIRSLSWKLSSYGFKLPEHGDLDIGKKLNETYYSYTFDIDDRLYKIFSDGRLCAYLSKYGNCETIRDVVNLGYDGLSKINGIGPKYLEKITSILSTYGIELN